MLKFFVLVFGFFVVVGLDKIVLCGIWKWFFEFVDFRKLCDIVNWIKLGGFILRGGKLLKFVKFGCFLFDISNVFLRFYEIIYYN